MSSTISRSLFKFMSIESVMLSNHLILCHPLLLCLKIRYMYAAAAAKSLQSCPTVRLHPWDSPGKNTGVGCYFLLQRIKVKSESEVAQSCLTLLDPMDCSLPGSSVHGIFQARVLEWGAIAFSEIHVYICTKNTYESNPTKILSYLRIMAFQVIVINTLNELHV